MVLRENLTCWWFVLVHLFGLVGEAWALDIVHDGWPNGPLAAAVRAGRTLVFTGNLTSPDYFHELLLDGDSLIVGARNVVYNISLDSLEEQSRIAWTSNPDDIYMCIIRQKPEEACQNYIRVIARQAHDRLLVCGTNAFRPFCRVYHYTPDGYELVGAENGIARCPYDPNHNSTAVYFDGELYSATVADISSRDALIYKKPIRSEQHDSQWLNDPNFVSSFVFSDNVYFFFREMAVENINCGKALFSRVARVCTSDRGGARVLRHTWTSFFKARLNCSLPGEFPFYFDEIQSTSFLGNGSVFPAIGARDSSVPMIYGVFTTPWNSLRGAAVCAYKMSDVVASFEGPYKEQRTVHSNWLPVRNSAVPKPHPAKMCADDSEKLSDQTLNFVKSHPLMDTAVTAYGGQPVLVQTSLEYSLTQIAVDWQVLSADYWSYDVLFIGTDNGRVLKAINRGRVEIKPYVIEVISVFDDGSPVTGIRVRRHATDRHRHRLIVMSRDEIRSIPLHRCHRHVTCSECVALRDPYCSWRNNKCVNSIYGYQSIESGKHALCESTDAPVKPVRSNKVTSTSQATPATEQHKTNPACVCNCSSQFSSHDAVKSVKLPKDNENGMSRTVSPTTADAGAVPTDRELRASARGNIGPCYDQSPDDPPLGRAVTGYNKSNKYTESIVAAISVLCVVVSLVVGFLLGLCVSRITHGFRHSLPTLRSSQVDARAWRAMSAKDISLEPPERMVRQNPYDVEPVKTFHTFHPYDVSGMPRNLAKQQNAPGQHNIFVNDLKINNSKLANGPVAESSLHPRRGVYL